jgi:hypothetical protein
VGPLARVEGLPLHAASVERALVGLAPSTPAPAGQPAVEGAQ